MKLRCAVLLLALGLSIKPALADDASARALAGKIIEMTNGKETMRAGFDAVMGEVIDNMARQGMPQTGVDEIRTTVAKWYDDQIKFDEIQPKIVDVYVKEFTEAELKDIVKFYSSPTGQKSIKTMPNVMHEAAEVAQEYTKAKIPSLNALLTPILVKYRDQAAAAGGGGAPAGGAPRSDTPPGGGMPPSSSGN